MSKLTAYWTVRKMIERERRMRERVFANHVGGKLESKIAECDKALAALEILRQAASITIDTPEAKRPTLFDEEENA